MCFSRRAWGNAVRARLTILKGEGSPRISELDPARPITIGRSRDNDIVIQDERASRVHVRICFEKGHWRLHDNKTLNGTRVGAALVERPIQLQDGLEFDIADM